MLSDCPPPTQLSPRSRPPPTLSNQEEYSFISAINVLQGTNWVWKSIRPPGSVQSSSRVGRRCYLQPRHAQKDFSIPDFFLGGYLSQTRDRKIGGIELSFGGTTCGVLKESQHTMPHTEKLCSTTKFGTNPRKKSFMKKHGYLTVLLFLVVVLPTACVQLLSAPLSAQLRRDGEKKTPLLTGDRVLAVIETLTS